MKFELTFRARHLGAIGSFSTFHAETESDKNLAAMEGSELLKKCIFLYDSYESICPIHATKILDTMTDDYGDEVTEARILPTGGGSNIICGRRGFNQEMRYRRERNKTLMGTALFDLPTWESLAIYFPQN